MKDGIRLGDGGESDSVYEWAPYFESSENLAPTIVVGVHVTAHLF